MTFGRHIRRGVCLAAGAFALLGCSWPAFAQQQPIANLLQPILDDAGKDTGWLVAADRQRVELRASPTLATNVSYRRQGGIISEDMPDYRLGFGGQPDFVFRLGMVLAGNSREEREFASVAGVAFRAEPSLPTPSVSLFSSASEGYAGLFVLRAAGKTFGGMAVPSEQADGWVTLLVFDTLSAMDALESTSLSGSTAEVEATLVSLTDSTEEFGLKFDLDLTDFTDAKYAYNLELNRRRQAQILGHPFSEGPLLR